MELNGLGGLRLKGGVEVYDVMINEYNFILLVHFGID